MLVTTAFLQRCRQARAFGLLCVLIVFGVALVPGQVESTPSRSTPPTAITYLPMVRGWHRFRIAFTAGFRLIQPYLRGDLYIASFDGTDARQLTHIPGDASFVTWAPDGEHLAYIVATGARFSSSPATALQTINLTNSEIMTLTATLPDTQLASPVWSPDGRWIAFTSTQSNTATLAITSVDGVQIQQLMSYTGTISGLVWSRDSTRIAFAAGASSARDIYVIGADGDHLQQLTNQPADDFAPTWLPDGEHLAFITLRDDPSAVYTVRNDGTLQTRLATLTEKIGDRSPAAWAPDGRTLAFADGYHPIYGHPIYGLDLQTGIEHVISDPYSSTLPWPIVELAWSPNSAYLAATFEGIHSDNIAIIPADGTLDDTFIMPSNIIDSRNPAWAPR